MKYIDIPTNDGSTLHVSRIAMGSSMSMERLSSEEKFELYDYYLAQGGNCIDTARAYGGGQSEKMVGEYLKSRGVREQVILSTKGGHPTEEEPDKSRVNRKDLLADLDESLRSLYTDYIDIYWIHKDDPDCPVEELVDTANEMIRMGKVRKIGLSNFTIERMDAANRYAAESGQEGFYASQIQWSLAVSEDKYFAVHDCLTMTPSRYTYYSEHEIPVFSFSSQAQGFYSRLAEKGLDALPEDLVETYGSPDNLKRLDKIKAFAEEKNCSVSAVATAFLVNNKLPAVAIIGASSQDMLAQSLEGAEVDMTPEEADALYQV